MVLLDEWDAHLDDPNRQTLSALLDVWSANTSIIEVTHRG